MLGLNPNIPGQNGFFSVRRHWDIKPNQQEAAHHQCEYERKENNPINAQISSRAYNIQLMFHHILTSVDKYNTNNNKNMHTSTVKLELMVSLGYCGNTLWLRQYL